jgi:hypothetical protein
MTMATRRLSRTLITWPCMIKSTLDLRDYFARASTCQSKLEQFPLKVQSHTRIVRFPGHILNVLGIETFEIESEKELEAYFEVRHRACYHL